MMNLFENNIVFPEYVQFLKNQDTVIVINGCTGAWGMVDTSMLDKIKHCIDNKITPVSYIRSLENESERQQLAEIFQTMLEEKMLKSPGDKEFEIDIKDVEFKLTNKCNLKCIHCAAASDISNPDLLSTEQMKMIFDKIFSLNIESLILTGGEALIRKDIKELLRYAREKYKGTINILTNGTFIDKEMALLLRECVSAVSISIDGYDRQSTDFVRGNGVYNKAMQAIAYLREAGFDRDTIILTMTGTAQNYDHAEDFQNMCRELDVTGGVRQFTAEGRGRDNFESIGIKDYLLYNQKNTEDIDKIRESLKCRLFCRAGITKIAINEAGNIYPCLFLEKEEYRSGNILEDDLDKLFSSEKYNDFIRNRVRKRVVDNMDKCRDCNVRYFCTDSCAGMNDSFFNNEEICEDRCRQMKPYLVKVVWDES